MESRTSSGGHFATSLLFFGTTAVIALLLLISAAVVALSYWIGSFILSALILGGCFALAAVLIYLFSIRTAVSRLRNQIDTIYDVAQTAKTAYEWVTDKVSLLVRLYDLSRSR